jgi:hypothetical protein
MKKLNTIGNNFMMRNQIHHTGLYRSTHSVVLDSMNLPSRNSFVVGYKTNYNI